MNCENCGNPLENWQIPEHPDTPAICGGCYHRAVYLSSLLASGMIVSTDTVLVSPVGLSIEALSYWQQRALELLGPEAVIVSQ